MALAFLIFGPFIFLMTRSALGETEQKNSSLKKLFLSLFLILLVMYLLTVYVEKYNYYIQGYRSTSILFITMTVCGLVYWLIDRDKVFEGVQRPILFCFSVLAIAISFCLFIEILGDYNNQLFYSDNKYRLEDTRRGIGEPCSLPVLFVKNGFYEQEFRPPDDDLYSCFAKSDVARIEIKYISDNQIIITFFMIDGLKNVSNPLQVTYYKE